VHRLQRRLYGDQMAFTFPFGRSAGRSPHSMLSAINLLRPQDGGLSPCRHRIWCWGPTPHHEREDERAPPRVTDADEAMLADTRERWPFMLPSGCA
jgi:hypothetical protein